MRSIKIVQLPDDKTCIELEEIFVGGSETQTYCCYYYDGEKLDTSQYEVDYEGRIKGIRVRNYVNTINYIKELSRKLS